MEAEIKTQVEIGSQMPNWLSYPGAYKPAFLTRCLGDLMQVAYKAELNTALDSFFPEALQTSWFTSKFLIHF